MEGGRKSKVRRRILAQALPAMGIAKDRVSSLASHMKREYGGVNTDLTDGFSPEHLPALRSYFANFGISIDEIDWLKETNRSVGRVVAIEGPKSGPSQLFSEGVRDFLCVRAPGRHPRPSAGSIAETGDDGLVDLAKVANSAPPPGFLAKAWGQLKSGKLTGASISAMGRLGAIPETWAAAELVRTYGRQHEVSVFLVPSRFLSHERQLVVPIIGVRVVDNCRCIVSTAMSNTKKLSYSSIIEDSQLAKTMWDYGDRLKEISEEISASHTKNEMETILKEEYDFLCQASNRRETQYGRLDHFDRVRDVKDQIVKLAKAKIWFPPLV